MERRIGILRSWEQVCDAVDALGFLPFLSCGVPGFSVAELTPPENWLGRGENNPWSWRCEIANSRRVVYGKFFGGKIGFVSKDWFPDFANCRRNGYDFDALFDEGLASYSLKAVMDSIGGGKSTTELKRLTGLTKELDKHMTQLMMGTYIVISGFEQKRDKYGKGYGWPMARYQTPEAYLGGGFAEAVYSRPPEVSKARIAEHIEEAVSKSAAAVIL